MLLLLLEPVVLLPCSFCFSSSSCSSCPPWCLVVLVVNVVPPRFSLPWLSSCSSYTFACVLVLLLEEQRRENPHATAGNVREQSYALTCSTCLFASAVFAEDPPPSSTEQQSAPSRWREFRAKLFFRAPQASADGGTQRPGRGARAAPCMAPMWAVGRARGANQPVAPLK